jgi:hypothetical protein
VCHIHMGTCTHPASSNGDDSGATSTATIVPLAPTTQHWNSTDTDTINDDRVPTRTSTLQRLEHVCITPHEPGSCEWSHRGFYKHLGVVHVVEHSHVPRRPMHYAYLTHSEQTQTNAVHHAYACDRRLNNHTHTCMSCMCCTHDHVETRRPSHMTRTQHAHATQHTHAA